MTTCRCGTAGAQGENWRHVDRGIDERGIVRHLWWAQITASNGVPFEGCVRVSYWSKEPAGRVTFVWLLQPKGEPGKRSEGACTSVGDGISQIMGDAFGFGSIVERWAERIAPGKKRRETKWLPPSPDEPVPF